jgi:hypothetical protein
VVKTKTKGFYDQAWPGDSLVAGFGCRPTYQKYFLFFLTGDLDLGVNSSSTQHKNFGFIFGAFSELKKSGAGCFFQHSGRLFGSFLHCSSVSSFGIKASSV